MKTLQALHWSGLDQAGNVEACMDKYLLLRSADMKLALRHAGLEFKMTLASAQVSSMLHLLEGTCCRSPEASR